MLSPRLLLASLLELLITAQFAGIECGTVRVGHRASIETGLMSLVQIVGTGVLSKLVELLASLLASAEKLLPLIGVVMRAVCVVANVLAGVCIGCWTGPARRDRDREEYGRNINALPQHDSMVSRDNFFSNPFNLNTHKKLVDAAP